MKSKKLCLLLIAVLVLLTACNSSVSIGDDGIQATPEKFEKAFNKQADGLQIESLTYSNEGTVVTCNLTAPYPSFKLTMGENSKTIAYFFLLSPYSSERIEEDVETLRITFRGVCKTLEPKMSEEEANRILDEAKLADADAPEEIVIQRDSYQYRIKNTNGNKSIEVIVK